MWGGRYIGLILQKGLSQAVQYLPQGGNFISVSQNALGRFSQSHRSSGITARRGREGVRLYRNRAFVKSNLLKSRSSSYP